MYLSGAQQAPADLYTINEEGESDTSRQNSQDPESDASRQNSRKVSLPGEQTPQEGLQTISEDEDIRRARENVDDLPSSSEQHAQSGSQLMKQDQEVREADQVPVNSSSSWEQQQQRQHTHSSGREADQDVVISSPLDEQQHTQSSGREVDQEAVNISGDKHTTQLSGREADKNAVKISLPGDHHHAESLGPEVDQDAFKISLPGDQQHTQSSGIAADQGIVISSLPDQQLHTQSCGQDAVNPVILSEQHAQSYGQLRTGLQNFNADQEVHAVDESIIKVSLPGEMNTDVESNAAINLPSGSLRQAAVAFANESSGTQNLESQPGGTKDLSRAASEPDVSYDTLVKTAKQYQASQACTFWDDKAECYRWKPVCGTGPAKLGEYGNGIQMYFEFLRMLGFLFSLLFLLNGPLLALCRLGSFVDEDNFMYRFIGSLSVGNLGACASGGCQTWDDMQNRLIQPSGTHMLRDWTWWLGLLDAIAAGAVLLFGVVLSKWWLPRQKVKAAGRHITAGRFAVQVHGLPARIPHHTQYEEKLKEHFNQMLMEESNVKLLQQPPQLGQPHAVSEVVLVRQYEGAIGKFAEFGQLLLKLACFDANIKRAQTDKDVARFQKRKQDVEAKIKPLEQALESQIQQAEDERDVCGAYVVFRYEEYKDLILFKYRLSTSPLFRLCQRRKRCFFGKAIRVQQACEPSDIFWENLDCKARWRICRRTMTLVLTALSLVLCALLVLLTSFYSASRAAVPSQEVWVVKTGDISGVACWQVCDWQLYKDLSCNEEHDPSSFTAFDYTGTIPMPRNCAAQTIGSSGCHAERTWLSARFIEPQSVQCMKLRHNGLQKLEVYACSEASLPSSHGNYSTWRPEDHCVAMNDIMPSAGQRTISVQDINSQPLAVTPGDCTHPVSLEVAERAKTAAEQDGRAPESDSVVACFCTQKLREQGSQFRLPPYDTPEKELCQEWTFAKNVKLAKLVGTSLMVLSLNYLLMLLINFLVYREKHSSATTLCVSQMMKLFCAIFVNTGFMTLLINANIRGKLDSLPILGAILFKGNFHDFNAEWFVAVGSSLVLTMALQIFSTTMTSPIWSFIVHPIQVWWYRKAMGTQQMMNQLYVLPDFEFAYRMAQTMNVAFVTLMFSGGLPILHLLAAIYCMVAYWADKWCLLRGSRKPPAYNETIFILSSRLFYIAGFFHVVVAVLIYGNQTIFPSSWGSLQDLTGELIGMTVQEYDAVMRAYFVGTEEIRDELFNKYWQARSLDLGRNANWLLCVMLAIFLVYFALRLVWYWILRPLLGPFILTVRECCRKCAEKRIGTESRCLEPIDSVKKEKSVKGQTHLMSYNMSEHPKYHDVHVALVHARKRAASAQSCSPPGAESV